MMTPSEVCKQLNISTSTLRKYSLRFESEGILFKRKKITAEFTPSQRSRRYGSL